MTEQEKLINVDLYGDGSRDSRLRAEYIYCDHADVCSVYKEGKCFRKTTLFGVRCEFGRIACVDGGTKKTKMYGRVYSEAKDSERYHISAIPKPCGGRVRAKDQMAIMRVFLTPLLVWKKIIWHFFIIASEVMILPKRISPIGLNLWTENTPNPSVFTK